jgi:preprotein translocase SecE subunit
MRKIKDIVGAVRAFFVDVHAELKKCAWPSRGELTESTGVVIVSVVLLAAVVASFDYVVLFLLRIVTR